VKDNVLRLDGVTGDVSECSRGVPGWSCKMVPDERNALEGKITRLEEGNAALKKQLLDNKVPLPSAAISDSKPVAGLFSGIRLPSLAPNRVTNYFGDVWRRMVLVVANLQRDILRKG
jgi:hypothetical protein